MEGGESTIDDEIIVETTENVERVVMGRRLFDNDEGLCGDEPHSASPMVVHIPHQGDPWNEVRRRVSSSPMDSNVPSNEQ